MKIFFFPHILVNCMEVPNHQRLRIKRYLVRMQIGKKEYEKYGFSLCLRAFSFRIIQDIRMLRVSHLFEHLHGGGVPILDEARNDIDSYC